MSAPDRVVRVQLTRRRDGSYADFPNDPLLASFDRSDQKFAAIARREQKPVLNATDTDWLHHRQALVRNGIQVEFICGCNNDHWFVSGA